MSRGAIADGRPRRPMSSLPASPFASEWERRRVAVLRVDSRQRGRRPGTRAASSMTWSGRSQTFGGDIVELADKALVAAFGLEAVEDAPVRAALAALAIRKAAERARADGEGRA